MIFSIKLSSVKFIEFSFFKESIAAKSLVLLVHGGVLCTKMQHERFVVKFITANNCFVQLSDIWLRRLKTKVSTYLTQLRNYYVSLK